MPIDQHGFLGNEINEYRSDIRRAHATFFAMCREINDFAYRELLALKPPTNDGVRVTAAALMIKVLNDCQAAVILLEHGLVLQAEETLRPAIEAGFRLVLLCRDPTYFEAFAGGDQFDVKRSLHGATALSPERRKLLGDVERIARERLAKVRGTIKRDNLEELGIEEIARRAGLSDIYNSFYRILCLSTHTAPRALQRYIEVNDNDVPTGFRWGPETKGVQEALAICGSTYLMPWPAFSELFALREPSMITDLDKRFTALIESTAEDAGSES